MRKRVSFLKKAGISVFLSVVFVLGHCPGILAQTKPSDTPSAPPDQDFVYDPRGRRDPFIPLLRSKPQGQTGLAGVAAQEDLSLEGIIWDPEGTSYVVINGEVMKKGDISYSVKIVDIFENDANISINNRVYRYTLDKGESG